jgi:hypothetical protein
MTRSKVVVVEVARETGGAKAPWTSVVARQVQVAEIVGAG